MKEIAYLAMDVHTKHCVPGHMDANGSFKGPKIFRACEKNIVKALKEIKAKSKYLTLEEGNLAYWIAQVAAPYVSEVIRCDPKQNALFYRGSRKNDKVDTQKLCRLLRLGELKRVKMGTRMLLCVCETKKEGQMFDRAIYHAMSWSASEGWKASIP